MAAPNKGDSLFADASGNPLLGARQANVADPASTLTATITAGNIATITAGKATRVTLTYTTDDPATVADGAQTIADGDIATDAEIIATFDEFEDSVADLVTLTSELHDDHATLVTLLAELIADHATFITDITQNRTAINSILDVLEEMGFMIAT